MYHLTMGAVLIYRLVFTFVRKQKGAAILFIAFSDRGARSHVFRTLAEEHLSLFIAFPLTVVEALKNSPCVRTFLRRPFVCPSVIRTSFRAILHHRDVFFIHFTSFVMYFSLIFMSSYSFHCPHCTI